MSEELEESPTQVSRDDFVGWVDEFQSDLKQGLKDMEKNIEEMCGGF